MVNSNKKVIQLKLSKNFSFEELVNSRSYPELEIPCPEKSTIDTAIKLAKDILQPIRNKFGVINISSWLRSKELNEKLNGAKHSDHLCGAAADFSSKSFDTKVIFAWVIKSQLSYRQMILYDNFIHISINHKEKPFKKEVLIYDGKQYKKLGA